MENNELIRKYELMMIVDAKLNDEDKNAIFKDATEIITKNDGKVINSQVWLEKQKLTFEINKIKEGTFYLINFDAEGSVNKKIETALKLNERILRFVISKIEHATEPAKG